MAQTKIITREGFNLLSKELNTLWKEQRPEITKLVTWAAGLGDRSENADYQYNKKKLREIDRRIRHLEKALSDSKVVDYDKQQDGRVFFGAWVELEHETGRTVRFRIVGPEEIYGRNDYISIDSPMAKACIGKSVDEEVAVSAPYSTDYWVVVSISYSS